MESDIDNEAKLCISQFKLDMVSKFGLCVNVLCTSHKSISLDELLNVVNRVMNRKYPDVNHIDIRIACRLRSVVLYKQCFCRLARNYGYIVVDIASKLSMNHASICHSYKTFDDLLLCNNKDAVIIMEEVENELKTVFGADGYVQPNVEGSANP